MPRKIMVGLLHNEDGSPIIRAPRTLKVGIGMSKGRAIRVLIHPSSKKWNVVLGAFVGGKLKETFHEFETRQEAEAFYHANKEQAPQVTYPRKLPYFTFTKPVVQKDGSAGYEPDFAAIEATGPVPTDIGIVFMTSDPFEGAYRFWSATELKCSGDGVDALRSVSLEPDNPLAIEARAAGLKVFPIDNGCWTRGCPYANRECKVTSSLSFQLARSVRVGGTAFFQTTGYRSTSDIFSSLNEIETIVNMATSGRGIIGIPLRFKLRPYVTKHDGKSATQYSTRVEMDEVEIGKLQSRLIEQSMHGALQIEAAEAELAEADPEDDQPMIEPYEYGGPDPVDEEPAPPLVPAAIASAASQGSMAEKLRTREPDKAVKEGAE